MTDLLRWGSLSFPEKRWLRGRAGSGIAFINGHRKAAALSATAAIGLAGAVYFGIGYAHYGQIATAEEAAAMRAETANADLQDALARLRDELGAANQSLSMAQNRISMLSDEAQKQLAVSEQSASSKTDRVAQLTHALEQAQRELHLAEAQRVTLMARLSKAIADLNEGQARQQQALAGLDQWQKKVQQLTADRDKAASERDRLRARMSELEQKSSMQSPRQSPRPTGEAQPIPASPASAPPAAAAPAVSGSVAAPVGVAAAAPAGAVPMLPVAAAGAISGGLAQFERVLGSAGVDVGRLFAQYGVRTGEGGPFIPAPHGKYPNTSLSADKLAALSRLVNVLPVSAPLASYQIGSPFGVRGDPMNGHSAFHTGIDLLAPYMTPVYATAPGVVTYSGYRDDYGKVVEIDHGNGISTRYAHLHRQTVSVGQRVAAHTQIGFLGSTGRATGPHVHYEVLVNGEPQDPNKFMMLAHLVPGAR
ncbi:MAG TPA: peptidoglycan DD-metalloendopeptidase family protein [Stellaceae bacterium]|nr:peptidoglycan DD-metalloendopeptidase family protein [Stellaceae bacterium]